MDCETSFIVLRELFSLWESFEKMLEMILPPAVSDKKQEPGLVGYII